MGRMEWVLLGTLFLAFFGCASTIQHYKKERDYWKERATRDYVGYGP